MRMTGSDGAFDVMTGVSPTAADRIAGILGGVTDQPSRDLALLAERYWQAALAFEPIYATYVGERQFDDRLDDHSEAAIDAT